ncbi:MAG TPA: hypothetical protein PLK63_02330 [Catalimonadaceae bacterium]|nr:hypothetical protein [Catalimonadaceae bacterium]
MINVLYRYLLVIAGLLMSQEILSTGDQSSGQDHCPKLNLNWSSPIQQSGHLIFKPSRNQETFYLDLADINLCVEDEEEEDHEPTCKRLRVFPSSLFSTGQTIFQLLPFASRTYSSTFHPAFYQNLTCIRYIRFQVFRL